MILPHQGTGGLQQDKAGYTDQKKTCILWELCCNLPGAGKNPESFTKKVPSSWKNTVGVRLEGDIVKVLPNNCLLA